MLALGFAGLGARTWRSQQERNPADVDVEIEGLEPCLPLLVGDDR